MIFDNYWDEIKNMLFNLENKEQIERDYKLEKNFEEVINLRIKIISKPIISLILEERCISFERYLSAEEIRSKLSWILDLKEVSSNFNAQEEVDKAIFEVFYCVITELYNLPLDREIRKLIKESVAYENFIKH